MAKTARNLTVAVVMTAAAMAMPQANMAADAPVTGSAPMSHVRTRDPKVAAVVRRALDRSTTFRKLVAIIDGSKGDAELMGLIAHELSHTIEVIAERGVRNTEAKYLFYGRTAIHVSGGTHETHAAVKAMKTVRFRDREVDPPKRNSLTTTPEPHQRMGAPREEDARRHVANASVRHNPGVFCQPRCNQLRYRR